MNNCGISGPSSLRATTQQAADGFLKIKKQKFESRCAGE
jgi:hypothetical protein